LSAVKFTKDSYREFQAFLHDACGIYLGENKEYLIESRLKPLMEECSEPDFGKFVVLLKNNRILNLRDKTIEAMTTNETLWFRDKDPFDIVKDKLFAQMVADKKTGIKIWSSACSSGQEPYSLSILAEEAQASGLQLPTVRITATDISPAMVNRAKEGIYDQQSLARGLSDARRQKYFVEKGDDNWQVKPEIARRISFSQHNLLQSYSALGRFEIIFCRNVLIYFSKEVKQDILNRMADILQPGGYLILGTSESLAGITERFEMVNFRPGLAYKLKS